MREECGATGGLSEEGFKVKGSQAFEQTFGRIFIRLGRGSQSIFWVTGTAFKQPGIGKPKAGTWDEGVSWEI